VSTLLLFPLYASQSIPHSTPGEESNWNIFATLLPTDSTGFQV